MEAFWFKCAEILAIDENGVVKMETLTWQNIDPLCKTADRAMEERIKSLQADDPLTMQIASWERGEYLQLIDNKGFLVGCMNQVLSRELIKGITSQHFKVANIRVNKKMQRQAPQTTAADTELMVAFELQPINKHLPAEWFLRERLEYLCNRKSTLHIYEPGTDVKPVKHQKSLVELGITPENGRNYFILTTNVKCLEDTYTNGWFAEQCRSQSLTIERIGSVSEGISDILVEDGNRSKIGYLGTHLSATLATLMDYGIARVCKANFIKSVELEWPDVEDGGIYASISMVVEINPVGYESSVPGSANAEYYAGRFPEASRQYRELVVTIRRDCANEPLGISGDDVLSRLVPCERCGYYKIVDYDFGFNSKMGRLELDREIPENNVAKMLEQDGIDIYPLWNLDTCSCDIEQDPDEDPATL